MRIVISVRYRVQCAVPTEVRKQISNFEQHQILSGDTKIINKEKHHTIFLVLNYFKVLIIIIIDL